MKRLLIIGLLICSGAFASEFDFDYGDKNDMRGAWKMCATTGFTEGDCPKVYQKCWQPPMIYRKKHKTKTYCVDDPIFSTSEDDKNRYLEEGSKRAQEITGQGE